MPLTDVVPEKELSLTTVLIRGLLAGAVAGLMETTASALAGSNDAGFGLADDVLRSPQTCELSA